MDLNKEEEEIRVGVGIRKSSSKEGRRPHVVCVPYPAQGHIKPMQTLATLLHRDYNFHVSFVNTEHNQQRLLRSHGAEAVCGTASFRFFAIPDGLPPATNPDATQDIAALSAYLQKTGRQALLDLIGRLNTSGAPPVTCILADTSTPFMVEVAEEMAVPVALFWTASACSLLGYSQYASLISMGVLPLPDVSCLANGYLDKVVDDGIPSLEGITLKHLPSFVRTTDINDFMLNQVLRRIQFLSKIQCPIVMNTFDALESESVETLAATTLQKSACILPIGPLSLLLTNCRHDEQESSTTTKSSLLPEDPGCLHWLDGKLPGSVLYVNFGSITTLTPGQIEEFVYGLADSKLSFLWVVRPDLVRGLGSGSDSSSLLSRVEEITEGKGMSVSWCDQEKVLAHSAVGVFLTHSGWNSTIEALSCGVPIVCWPFFADQMTNSFACCNKWGMGVEISVELRREEVARVANIAMQGDKATEMRRMAEKWKRLAHQAANDCRNLDHLVKALVLRDDI